MTEKTEKINKIDVDKLATLARITIPEAEKEKVRQDIEAILAYVGQINEAADLTDSTDLGDSHSGSNSGSGSGVNLAPAEQYNSGVKNVLREDGEPHESGKFTGSILASAPKTEKGFIKVKKILG